MEAGSKPPARRGAAPLRLGYLVDSLVTGGAERLVVSFAEEVKRRPNVEFTVFTLDDTQTPFRSDLEVLGVPVVTLPGRSLVDPIRFFRLIRALRGRSIEYLHAHLTASTILGGAASALLGVPFATTVHNVKTSVRRTGGARRKLYLATLRRRKICRIAVGEAVAEANAADADGRPFAVIPNAVPESAVWTGADRDAVRAELDLAPDDVVMIAVGLLIGQKGYLDLVEAFARVAPDFPNAQVLVVGAMGWQELVTQLTERLAALGLSDRFRFLGVRRDVPRLLAACDLFVSSSHWEGAPVSLLEAMANRLPCVVTDVGDNRLTLKGTGALTPPPKEPVVFAEALAEMLGDPERRRDCADAAARAALEDFGVARWVDRLLALYCQQTMRKDWIAASTESSI